MTALSITEAAREAPDRIAIETDARSLSFAACAAAVDADTAAPGAPTAIIAAQIGRAHV